MDQYEKAAAEILDEKYNIAEAFDSKVDRAIYNAMLRLLVSLGYDAVIRDGKHIVFDTKEEEDE